MNSKYGCQWISIYTMSCVSVRHQIHFCLDDPVKRSPGKSAVTLAQRSRKVLGTFAQRFWDVSATFSGRFSNVLGTFQQRSRDVSATFSGRFCIVHVTSPQRSRNLSATFTQPLRNVHATSPQRSRNLWPRENYGPGKRPNYNFLSTIYLKMSIFC